MKYQCDKCGEYFDKVHAINYSEGEMFLVCQGCKEHEEARADYEYERQKEEGR